MLIEAEISSNAPIPTVWQLGWLSFMQPIALRRMYQAWGMTDDASLIRIWRRMRAHSPIARTLLTRYALVLAVVMSLTTASVASAFAWSHARIDSFPVLCGLAGGIAGGLVVSMARSMAHGVLLGVGLSLMLSVAAAAAFDVE
jgi:hypothetical protein